MTKIINVIELRGQVYLGIPHAALNIRQLLNLIFFTPAKKHPDMTRQRSRRQAAKDLAAARRLKAQAIPLCRVAPVDPPDNLDAWDRSRWFSQGVQGVRGGGLL